MSDLEKIYNRFQTLGVPIEITELDISTPDEQLQADYLRDFLTLSFSHPEIEGVMLWGFVEGHHWRPDAALWHANWAIKPAGQVWTDLVKKKWWTDAALTTDAEGVASVRGFLGDYQVSAHADGVTQTADFRLPPQGDTLEIRLNPPH